MAKFIHNNSGDTLIVRGIEMLDEAYYQIPDNVLSSWRNDIVINEKVISGDLQMSSDGVTPITDALTGLAYLRGESVTVGNAIAVASVPDPQPFAQPTYRTKRDSTATWIECPENATTNSDFVLTAERYVSGGGIIIKDAKEGDYLTASVIDTDGVIPEPYRAALCEAYPIVATYIVKMWLVPYEGYRKIEIDTYPLNAKISAGLYLRVSYVAANTAGTRKMAINYNLTKKL